VSINQLASKIYDLKHNHNNGEQKKKKQKYVEYGSVSLRL